MAIAGRSGTGAAGRHAQARRQRGRCCRGAGRAARARRRRRTARRPPTRCSRSPTIRSRRAPTTPSPPRTKALADGQQAAFRSLLKRLVPVTAYQRLRRLRPIQAGDLVEGVSVRSERNSSTDYIASLDFSFQSKARARPAAPRGHPLHGRAGAGAHRRADLANGRLGRAEGRGGVDQRLEGPRPGACAHAGQAAGRSRRRSRADAVNALAEGDGSAIRTLVAAYGSELVLVAVAEQDIAAKRLNVTLAGRDAVGAFMLQAHLSPRPRRPRLRQRAGGRGLARHPRGPLEGHQVSPCRRRRRTAHGRQRPAGCRGVSRHERMAATSAASCRPRRASRSWRWRACRHAAPA